MVQEGSLVFSTCELNINNVNLTLTHLPGYQSRFPMDEQVSTDDNKHVKFTAKFERKRFLCICIQEGKFLPRSNIVFDKSNNIEKENKRSRDEAELSLQTYAVYDTDSKILYLSNIKKKTLLEVIINDYIVKSSEPVISIEYFYKDVETFISEIKEAGKISFAKVTDTQASLFSEDNSFDPRWSLDAADFSIELNYTSRDSFVNRVREFCNIAHKGKISNLICKGKGDNNFEKIFRVDKFIDKVSLKITSNDDGIYEDTIVFSELIDKVVLL